MARQTMLAVAIADEGITSRPHLEHVGKIFSRQDRRVLVIHRRFAHDFPHHAGGKSTRPGMVDQGWRSAPKHQLGLAAMALRHPLGGLPDACFQQVGGRL